MSWGRWGVVDALFLMMTAIIVWREVRVWIMESKGQRCDRCQDVSEEIRSIRTVKNESGSRKRNTMYMFETFI